MSADFARTDGKKGGWWEWKPEKQALEVLHCTGELMIRQDETSKRANGLVFLDNRESALGPSHGPAFERADGAVERHGAGTGIGAGHAEAAGR